MKSWPLSVSRPLVTTRQHDTHKRSMWIGEFQEQYWCNNRSRMRDWFKIQPWRIHLCSWYPKMSVHSLSLYIYMSLCNIVFMSFSVLLFCLFLEKMFLLYFPLFILYLSRSIACSVAYTQSWSQTCNNIRISKCNWDVYYYYYYIYIKVNISIKYRIQSIFKIYYQLFFLCIPISHHLYFVYRF